MDRVIRSLFGWGPTLTLMLAMSAYVGAYSWPSSWWFDVRSVAVFDAKEGEPITLLVDRTINRPFSGEWGVVIRKVTDTGVTVKCQGSGLGNYRVDAQLPNPMTMEWWAGKDCAHLPAGRYIMTTVWAFPGWMGVKKTVSVDSNPFTVYPAPEGG